MAILKNLIVNGVARILGDLYASKFIGTLQGDVDGNAKTATTAVNATQASNAATSDTSNVALAVKDYADSSRQIKIGYAGAGLTSSTMSYALGFANNTNETQIKDVSKAEFKNWITTSNGDWDINVSSANQLKISGSNATFNWTGKDGQPTWLWGGNDPSNMYVYNPSNFSVNSSAYVYNAGFKFGAKGLQYFNIITENTSGKNNAAPLKNTWCHVIRVNHANNDGYLTDLATDFNITGWWYRGFNYGNEVGWKRIIDSGCISSYALTSHQSFKDLCSTLGEGTSDVTDGTMFITSYASDAGFADSNAVNVPYKRKASCLWNYINNKCASVYQPKGTYLTEHQSLADYATKSWVNNQGFAKGTIPSLAGYATQSWVTNQGYITSSSLSGYLPLSGGTMSTSSRISYSKLYMGQSDNSCQVLFNGTVTASNANYWSISQAGDAMFASKVTSNAFYANSDVRLKNIISDIDVDLSKIKLIPKEFYTLKGSDVIQIGTIAQEVQKVFPEVVNKNSAGYLSVDYSRLSIVALAAIDKLNDKIKELENVLNNSK